MQDKGPERSRKVHIRFGIRDKILISFLALSLISVGIISSLALRYIGSVGALTKQYSATLGETVMSVSIAALEDQGRRTIYQKADDVSQQIYFYLQLHPNLDEDAMMKDSELRTIAVQSVGRTGNTTVYDTNGTVLFAADPKLVGTNLRQQGGEPTYFSSIFLRSLLGQDASARLRVGSPMLLRSMRLRWKERIGLHYTTAGAGGEGGTVARIPRCDLRVASCDPEPGGGGC